MSERVLSGLAVSGGVAVGPAFALAEPIADSLAEGAQAALAALARVADELGRTAARLTAQGRELQAEIIDANRLMAEDPSLLADVADLAGRLPAATALRTLVAGKLDRQVNS